MKERTHKQINSGKSSDNILSRSAESSTLRVSNPGTSIELTSGMSPCLDNRPYVGFSPTSPQNDAGLRVEPPVSEPNALHTLNTALYTTLVKETLRTLLTKRKDTQICNNIHNMQTAKGPTNWTIYYQGHNKKTKPVQQIKLKQNENKLTAKNVPSTQ